MSILLSRIKHKPLGAALQVAAFALLLIPLHDIPW